MGLDSSAVKALAAEIGADLCGIAVADAFSGAPPGFHPRDIMPECQSVVVLACRFPRIAMSLGPDGYTLTRNQMVKIMDVMAVSLAKVLQSQDIKAVPKTSLGGRRCSDGRYRDSLSLKHAGLLAGLGVLGRNTLLINDKLGNMLWMSAVLINLTLAADPPAAYAACPPNCSACIRACPAGALGGELMDQLRCYEHAYSTESGEEQINCWRCRDVCPNRDGIR